MNAEDVRIGIEHITKETKKRYRKQKYPDKYL